MSDEASKPQGFKPSDVLTLPKEERQLVNWLVRRQKASLLELADYLKQSDESVLSLLNNLVEKKFVYTKQEDGQILYYAHVAGKTTSRLSNKMWDKLNNI